MNIYQFRSLSTMRNVLIFINFIIVFFYASVILLTTKYIISNQMAKEFLDTLTVLPGHPLKVFYGSLLLYGVLTALIYAGSIHEKMDKNRVIVLALLETIVCFALIMKLSMAYNGLILLIFCNCLYHLKDDKYSKWIMALLVAAYLLSNYDIFSSVFPMPDISAYFQVYDMHARGMLMVTKTLLETFNILSFIVFMIVYITEQIQENENISKELSMIQTVNKELQDYAAMTEKIGENNERKRLAREIHDTLGHALTGIAAGVDACIAMIDINPQATKQQLFVVSKVVRQGIGDVRNSLNKLRPGALEERGLLGAIEKMIDEFASISDLKVTLNSRLEKLDFDKTKEDTIFRIIQECMTNAVRHGQASHVEIDIWQEDEMLHLTIQDDGSGCEEIHYGFGLKQMQERVAIVNGNVMFDGHHGFKTVVKMPLQKGEKYD